MLSSIDAILAEILSGSAALHELIGPAENLAEALSHLVDLFLGKAAERRRASGLAAADRAISPPTICPKRAPPSPTASSPNSRAPSGCAPNSLVEELKALRRLANRVVMGVGKYLSHEDLIAAFTLRSKRLVTQEALGAYIDEAAPDEKIERLLFVEENIIGVGKQAPAWRPLSCRC